MAKKFESVGTGILKDFAKKSEAMLNSQTIVEIPLEQIHENPNNIKIFGMNNIDRLAETINDEGFVGAIEVIKTEDESYEISGGHRRYLAMKELGKKTIPCIILPKLADEDKAKRLLSSNLNTRQLDPPTISRMIIYYITDCLKKSGRGLKSSDKAEIMQFFGISEQQLYRYLSIDKMIPELRDYCENPDFPWTRLQSAANMTEDQQREVYEKINTYIEEYPGEYSSAKIRQICDSVSAKNKNIDRGREIEEEESKRETIKSMQPTPPFGNIPDTTPSSYGDNVSSVFDTTETTNTVSAASSSERLEQNFMNIPTYDENGVKSNPLSSTEEESPDATFDQMPTYKGKNTVSVENIPVVASAPAEPVAEILVNKGIDYLNMAVNARPQNRKEMEQAIQSLKSLIEQLETNLNTI